MNIVFIFVYSLFNHQKLPALKYKILVPVVSSIMLLTGLAIAQVPSKKSLEDERKSLLSEITDAQNELKETRQESRVTLAQLKALQAKLAAREQLINSINQEVGDINVNIEKINVEVKQLQKQIAALEVAYAQSVRYAYKTQNAQNVVAFLLTADNFNDAMRRYQYMKKMRDFRMHQADKLKNNHKKLDQNALSLKNNKVKKETLKTDEEKQKLALEKEKETKDAMVVELKSREKDLSTTIAKKQADARKLDATIKSIINKEIEIARKKAAEEEMKRQAIIAKKAEEERIRKQSELAKQQEADAIAKAEADKQKAAAKKQQEALIAKQKEEEAKIAAQKNSSPTPVTVASNNTKPAASTANTAKTEPAIAKNTSNTSPKNVLSSNARPDEPPKAAVTPPKITNKEATPNYKNSLSADDQQLSQNFSANKGRLPWPVASGYISAPFGKYKHPLEPKVTLENAGVDIATNAGAAVKTVFQGTISRVVNIAGTYTVVINHGEYFTVYSYLSSVNVTAGQKVTNGQHIGVVGKNDDGEHVVHFEVCRVNANNSITNENPAGWISR